MFGGIKRALGWGAPTKIERRRAPDLEQIGEPGVPDGALASVWDLHDSRMPNTPVRIRDARALLAGEKRAPMPSTFDMQDREAFRADGADKYERPRRTARRLAKKLARIKRPDAGLAPEAEKVSTKIEQWDNGLLDELFPDHAVIEILLNEGEILAYMIPMPCHYELIPTLYDMDGDKEPLIGGDGYDALPEHKRKEYEQKSDGSYMRMRRAYRVNAKDETDDGSPEFEVDMKKAADHFEGRMQHAYAKNIPIHLEILSRLDFIPINPRFSGKRVKVDGAIIRKLFRRSELLSKGYRWDGCWEQLEPVDPYDGNTDGEFYLYILFKYNLDHEPILIYQVGTHGTTFADGESAVVNLKDEYGLDELPIAFEYGQHYAASNPDQRSHPFTRSFMQNWLNRDAILTGLNVSTWLSGFPMWGQKITKDSIPQAISGDVDLTFQIEANTVKPIFGDLIELTSRGSNNDVKTLLMAFEALNEDDVTAPSVLGGEGATSGLDRQVQGRDFEAGEGDVIEGYRRIKEACGRFGLMIGTALARKHDLPVRLYVSSPTPVAQSGSQATTRQMVELNGDLAGETWDVIAEFPHLPGENLANTSLLVTLAEKELILVEEFRELWGDPHPEIFAAKLRLQRYFNSEMGQMDLLEGMAEYLADKKLKQKLQLASQGRVTAGGSPKALMDSLMGGGGAAVAGTVVQDRGQAALGGANAAAISADAAAMGGPTAGPSAGADLAA